VKVVELHLKRARIDRGNQVALVDELAFLDSQALELAVDPECVSLMTTMAALLGGLPVAPAGGVASELRRPLGIAIVGGLIVSGRGGSPHRKRLTYRSINTRSASRRTGR
jgi:hypothetical protein